MLTELYRGLRTVAVVCALATAGAAGAQGVTGSGSTAWNRLSPVQKGVLTQLERDWSTISPTQQQKWVEVANRFPTMPAEERERVQQRIAEWSRLSPKERGQARLNFQEARQLSPQERQQQWEVYRALPPDQRRALAERGRPNPATARPGVSDASVKSSVVGAQGSVPARPVGPTVVQRGAGATTNLVSKPTTPPLHQQTGLPKVAAAPGFVDRATLLPQRGAQGAAAHAPAINDDKSKAQ
jgi:Protein of unknown function (DUF3106)